MLVFATQRLVQPLAGWLAQQWLAATRLTLVLRHETSVRRAVTHTLLALAFIAWALGTPGIGRVARAAFGVVGALSLVAALSWMLPSFNAVASPAPHGEAGSAWA